MTNCILHRNAEGHLECPDCHWIYKGKAESPGRNCPNYPDLNTPEHRERIREKMLAELQPHIDAHKMPYAELARIGTQIDQCMTCAEFNGHACTLRGSTCKKWVRWKEALAFMMPCKSFASDPTAE